MFWPSKLSEWVDVVTRVGAILGAAWALYTYYRGLRYKAADVLLKMEEEFRAVLPTYELIENQENYRETIEPVVVKAVNDERLEEGEVKTLVNIDRCLRFFFLCSVLNKSLAVDVGVLSRAYYYYIGILARRDRERTALLTYIRTFYPSLQDWIKRNKRRLEKYRAK